MKEGILYEKNNEIFMCVKKMSYIMYDFELVPKYILEPKDVLEKKIKEYNMITEDIINSFKKEKRICDNFILLKIKGLSNNSFKKELKFMGIWDIFNNPKIEFESKKIDEFLNERLGRELMQIEKNIIIEEDVSLYNEIGINKDNCDKYKIELEKRIEEILDNNKGIKEDFFLMIKNYLNNLELINKSLVYNLMLLDFKENLNKGLIYLSLKYGLDEAEKWYLEELENYKIKELLSKI